MNDKLKEAVSEAIREALGGALDCGRVWSAWGHGTMSEDDFHPVAEDAERVAEIADAVLLAFKSDVAAAQEAVAWQVGDDFYTSESLAIEGIQQWGPSGAIAIPLYAAPVAAAPAIPQALIDLADYFANYKTLNEEAQDEDKDRANEILALAIDAIDGRAPVAAAPVEPDLDAYDPASGELAAQWLYRNGLEKLAVVVRGQLDIRAARIRELSARSTPAAPGIDLTDLRLTVKRLADLIRNYRDHPKTTDFWRPAWCAVLRRTEELASDIDASPKGGSDAWDALLDAASALLKAFDDSEHPFIAAGAAERVRVAIAAMHATSAEVGP